MNHMEQHQKELEAALGVAVQKLQNEFRAIRSSRPSIQLVEDIPVVYYDEKLTIKQLGSLSVRPPRDIEIGVWDKNAVGPVVKAIQEANVGLSTAADGTVVRASLPPLTDERRAEFVKLVKKMAEETRIQVRGRRDEAIKKIKAAEEEKKLDEDQVFRGKEQIQKLIDETNRKIEAAVEGKLKELNE